MLHPGSLSVPQQVFTNAVFPGSGCLAFGEARKTLSGKKDFQNFLTGLLFPGRGVVLISGAKKIGGGISATGFF